MREHLQLVYQKYLLVQTKRDQSPVVSKQTMICAFEYYINFIINIFWAFCVNMKFFYKLREQKETEDICS